MALLWTIWILAYLLIVLLLVRGTNKITKDSKTVFGSLATNINEYFLIINSYIAHQKNSLEKFDDLIDVVYAKKKRFIHNKSHWLTDQYELFVGLKDDINYLADYTGDEFDTNTLNKQTDELFGFLFSIKPRQKTVRFFLGLITLWIWLGFVEDGVKM